MEDTSVNVFLPSARFARAPQILQLSGAPAKTAQLMSSNRGGVPGAVMGAR